MPAARALRLPIRILAALGLALVLIACGSSESRFRSHMERGKQYLAADNLLKASVEFRNALQIAPKNPEALYFNGKVAERRGSIREAVQFYQATVDVRPNDNGARASLAKIFILAGATQQALEVIAPGLLDHPDDPDLLAARAAARHEFKDDSEARADAERAVAVAPTNENAIGVLAALALRAGDTGRAVSIAAEAVRKAPDSVGLRRILTSVYLSTGQPHPAEEQMRKVILLEPNELAPRMELATHFARSRDLDDAQQVLEQAVRDLPHEDAAKLALVDFVTTQRSRQQGEKILKDFVALEPDNEDLRLALGMLVQRTGATQEAIAIYREVVRRDGTGPKGLAARDRIAAIDIVQSRDDEAKKLIAEVLAESPRDDDALIMRANIALAHGDAADAIPDLRAALRDQPKSIVLQRTLARAYVAKGESALAEEALRSVLDAQTTDPGAKIDLAQILLQTDRPAQAVTLLEKTAEKVPQDPQVRVALINAYLADRDIARARTAAEDLKKLHPDFAEGYQLAGRIARDENRLDDAEKDLERALELKPGSVDILTSLTRSSLDRGRAAIAIARLQRVREKDPNNVQILDLLGETYLEVKDLPHATEALTKAGALAPRSWIPYRDLAQVRLAAGDANGAIMQYRKAFELAPDQPRVVVELASLYQKEGHVDSAVACYEALYKGDSSARRIAANNMAMLLVTYKTDRASLDRARTLTAGFDATADPSLLDTAGWVRFKRREYREAVGLLERAADRSPNSRVIRYHLGMAQLQLGEKENARANLESALAGPGNFAGSEEARSALASLRTPRAG